MLVMNSEKGSGKTMGGRDPGLFQIGGDARGKAIPLQAWTGPGGSKRLRLPDFQTVDT